MAILLRFVFWLLCAASVGWLWRQGWVGGTGALVALAFGTALTLWRFGPVRRKRSALRCVQMGKQPVA